MRYKYLLYGMKVESELKIDEAYEKDFDSCADVCVEIKDIPEYVKDILKNSPIKSGSQIIKGKGFVYFNVEDLAQYYVEKDKIYVSVIDDTQPREVRCFLLGTAFGICMILRDTLALHGGAVGKCGRGIIVTGESGAGKSTVVDGLLNGGWEFVADDVCAISCNEDDIHINMAYPQQKLCRDAAVKMGYDLEKLIYINESRDKFAIRLEKGYLPEGVRFNALFELKLSDSDELKITKLEGMDKMYAVTRNIFRSEEVFDVWKMSPQLMKNCLLTSKNIDVYSIERPKNKDTVGEILKFVSDSINNIGE